MNEQPLPEILQIQLPELALPILEDSDYPDIEIPVHFQKLIDIGFYTRGEVLSFTAFSQQIQGLTMMIDPLVNSIREHKEKNKKPSGLILPDMPKIVIP